MLNYSSSPSSDFNNRNALEQDASLVVADGIDAPGAPQGGGTLKLGPLVRTFIRKGWIVAGVTAITTSAGLLYTYFQPYRYSGNFYLLVEPITAAARLTDPSTIARTGGNPSAAFTQLDYPTNLAFLQSPGMTFRIANDVKEATNSDKNVAAIWKGVRDNLTVNWVRSATGRDATKLFEVSYQGTDPEEVEEILRVAAETFVTYSAQDRSSSIKEGVKFIDEQLPSVQANLDSLKKRQRQIREQYKTIDPTINAQVLAEQLAALEGQKVTLDQQLASQSALVAAIEKELNLTKDEAVTAEIFTADEQRNQLLAELNRINIAIATTSATFTDNSSQMISLKEQKENIEQLLEKRTQAILSQVKTPLSPNTPDLDFRDPTRLGLSQQLLEASNQVRALRAQLAPIDNQINNIKREIQTLPKVMDEYTTLTREIELNSQLTDRLQLQRETLRLEASQELPWQLISDPQIPLDASGEYLGTPPSRTRSLALGFLGGFTVSAIGIYLWERLRNQFYSSADMKDLLEYPILGELPMQETVFESVQSSSLESTPTVSDEPAVVFPHVEKDNATILKTAGGENDYASPLPTTSLATKAAETDDAHELLSSPLFNTQDTTEPASENGTFLDTDDELSRELAISSFLTFPAEFDQIFTDLTFLYRNPPLKSIAFTSIDPEDGQSTMLLNMAITAADLGKRVLVVDGNRDHTALYRWLNLNNEQGLSDYLSQAHGLKEIVQSTPDFPNIDLVSYGSNPDLKHLWLPRMKNFMVEVQGQYDLILYDLPHFSDSTDVYNIGAETDGMIWVVAKKKTKRSKAVRAAQKAKELGLPVLGIISNLN